MSVGRMWLLNCGWIGVENSLMMYRQGFGDRRIVPVTATVVETDEGYLVFDTGLNADAVDDPEGALGPKAGALVEFDEGHTLLAHLDTLGIAASDVRWLANSHLHWDHTGGNKDLRPTEVLVQREELRFANDPDDFVAQIFLKDQFALPQQVTEIDGDFVVTQGVGLINTRGHTPGHQSLLVRLDSGRRVLCAGDAAYTTANIDEAWPPGNAWSMPEASRALRRMAFERDFGAAEIIVGHDEALWERTGERIREIR